MCGFCNYLGGGLVVEDSRNTYTPLWRTGQQTLWPVFDTKTETANVFLRDLIVSNDIPERFVKRATLTSFSDGSAHVTIAFDLSPEETNFLITIGNPVEND